MKFCRDCQHYRFSGEHDMKKCFRKAYELTLVDPVTGRSGSRGHNLLDPTVERTLAGWHQFYMCGISGRYFKERE